MKSPLSLLLFRGLLRLFPHDFRLRFGEEMLQVFSDQWRAARATGRLGVFRLWLRTLPGLCRSAVLEHMERPRMSSLDGREPVLETLRADLHFAVRVLWKTPLFTLVAVGCIALGSGAVTTIFSTMNALVLRPLPGTADGARLIRIERKRPGGDDGVSLSYPWYRQIVERAHTLDGVVAWSKAALVLRGGTDPGDAVYGEMVSGNFFSVLGVAPRLGRFFSPEEDQNELTNPVIVVSEGYWKNRLGGDSATIGRDMIVNGRTFTLIGVAPATFQGADAPIRSDAWVPLHMQRAIRTLPGPIDDPAASWLRVAARLRPGVSRSAARMELAALGEAIVAEAPASEPFREYSELRASLFTGLPPDATSTLARFLGLLLGAAALVLLIASVNVAGMLSARAIERRREMAVRAALGAGQARLVRQLLTEILVLFGLGAAGGALMSLAATRALERIPLPTQLPMRLLLAPDPRVFAFALLVSLVTGLIVGLGPTRQALKSNVLDRLRDGSSLNSGTRSLMGSALIVGQLAVSLVLLVGAGLLGKGLLRANRIDPGFEASGVATVLLDTDAWGFDEARGRRFYDALDRRLEGLPGVTAVSAATTLPLTFHGSGSEIEPDQPLASGVNRTVPIEQIMIGPSYFSALRIPIVEGRPVAGADVQGSGRVAVVNQTMARKYWPAGSALGRTFRYNGQPITIIGIARDAKYGSLTETTPPLAYFPLAQEWRAQRNLLVRTSADPRVIGPAIASAIRETDAAAPRVTLTTLAEASTLSLLPGRVAALVTGVLGGVGVLLSIAGLYGVISYSAARRTREIGIRLALGATRESVLGLIVREGAYLAAWGIGAGILLAGLATPLLRSLLFGMSPLDPVTYLAMAGGLATVALLASYLPARRAASAEPWVVLRTE